ncbi:hypothetical protein J3F84DRAFT_373531 [Trichoderma pleuroticola]
MRLLLIIGRLTDKVCESNLFIPILPGNEVTRYRVFLSQKARPIIFASSAGMPARPTSFLFFLQWAHFVLPWTLQRYIRIVILRRGFALGIMLFSVLYSLNLIIRSL